MIMIKLLKYIFISYFIILIYAMIRGRAGLKDNPTLIEEYVIVVCLFVCLDVLLWILKRMRRENKKYNWIEYPTEKNRRADTRAKKNIWSPMCVVADLKKSYGDAFGLGVCVMPTGKLEPPLIRIPIHIFSSNYSEFWYIFIASS